MDYVEILNSPLNQINITDLAAQVVRDYPNDFSEILELSACSDEKIAWRASWLIEKISELRADFFTPQVLDKIIKLTTGSRFQGVQRSLLSVLLNVKLPPELSVEFINMCFERMISPKAPVAIQVLSMKILYKFAEIEPDFLSELQACLHAVNEQDYSAGWQAARRNVLKSIKPSRTRRD
ncbi:MAG: hypothetical protein LBV75_08965 [Paludibacter sp.]|jgi:hypothetical protein|nr:hypothetical protein [Paludibacter sp.]